MFYILLIRFAHQNALKLFPQNSTSFRSPNCFPKTLHHKKKENTYSKTLKQKDLQTVLIRTTQKKELLILILISSTELTPLQKVLIIRKYSSCSAHLNRKNFSTEKLFYTRCSSSPWFPLQDLLLYRTSHQKVLYKILYSSFCSHHDLQTVSNKTIQKILILLLILLPQMVSQNDTSFRSPKRSSSCFPKRQRKAYPKKPSKSPQNTILLLDMPKSR